MDTITHAQVGGPPHDWRGLIVIDLATGSPVGEVIEVNTAEGWLQRYVTDESGSVVSDGDGAKRERVEGDFEIRRP
ncbi:MAG: hypothetical protein EON87_00905 [Brevundimonas sp.]|nr:MAG: hypothetical protein EON87_00905 [Brevundimonas sp.]